MATASHFAGYELLQEIGGGGMGVVHRARRLGGLGPEVALKRLLPAQLAPDGVARFHHEIAAVVALHSHPHIVGVVDAGEIGGEPFLVMEYVRGVVLKDLVTPQPQLSVANACEMVRQAALGVHYAHQRGILHRDLKPSNLLLNGFGVVKVADFGLAKLRSDEPLTHTGAQMGTLAYMAPEQLRNAKSVGPRADVYGLGRTLVALLIGKLPTKGGPGDRPDLPADLVALLDRLTATAPNDRPASAADVALLLKPFCVGCNLADVLGAHAEGVIEPPSPLEATTPAATPLDVTWDVVVLDKVGKREASLTEPDVAPLRAGAELRVRVRLNRPAFVYLVSVGGDGQVTPMHPWPAMKWEEVPEPQAVRVLTLPLTASADEETSWPLGGPAGVESLMLLVHTEPLPKSWLQERLKGHLRGPQVPVETLADAKQCVWFTHRAERGGEQEKTFTAVAEKGFGAAQPIDDPVLQRHARLRRLVDERLTLAHAVSFVNLG